MFGHLVHILASTFFVYVVYIYIFAPLHLLFSLLFYRLFVLTDLYVFFSYASTLSASQIP